MKRVQKVFAVLLASSVLAVAPTATAQVVFSNPWNPGATDAGAWSQPSQLLAGQFRLAANAAVTGASWYGTMFSADPLNTGDTWGFDLQFRLDGSVPAGIFASRSVVADVFDTGINVENERAYLFTASFSSLNLAGATSYFFSASNTQQANTFRWNTGLDASYSSFYSFDGGATWADLAAARRGPLNFTLEAATTATPEPSTYVLMASGLLFVGGMARRRKRAPAP